MELLRAEEKRIKDLFNDNYQFEIPSYQRPYVWGEDQISQLFEDLEEIIAEYELLDEKEQEEYYYFMGSVVLIREKHTERTPVVDGQQRLITLVIFLSVLRYLFKEQDAKDSVSKYLYRQGSKIENIQASYRLMVHPDCRAFFEDYIQNETGMELLLEGLIDSPPPVPTRKFFTKMRNSF